MTVPHNRYIYRMDDPELPASIPLIAVRPFRPAPVGQRHRGGRRQSGEPAERERAGWLRRETGQREVLVACVLAVLAGRVEPGTDHRGAGRRVAEDVARRAELVVICLDRTR
jgi:hypothetical protein